MREIVELKNKSTVKSAARMSKKGPLSSDAVLPILHLNGVKITPPTIFSRIRCHREE